MSAGMGVPDKCNASKGPQRCPKEAQSFPAVWGYLGVIFRERPVHEQRWRAKPVYRACVNHHHHHHHPSQTGPTGSPERHRPLQRGPEGPPRAASVSPPEQCIKYGRFDMLPRRAHRGVPKRPRGFPERPSVASAGIRGPVPT